MESNQFNVILTLLVFFPVFGALLILFLKQMGHGSDDLAKRVATAVSAVTLGIAVVALLMFDKTNPNLQLIDKFDWIPSWGISYYLGVDGLSILMILLIASTGINC